MSPSYEATIGLTLAQAGACAEDDQPVVWTVRIRALDTDIRREPGQRTTAGRLPARPGGDPPNCDYLRDQ